MANEPEEQWARLAARLRQLRSASGLSGPGLAQRTGWSQSKVSRIENKVTRPSVADVKVWCQQTGARPDVSEQLTDLATNLFGGHQTWAQLDLAERQRQVAELEAAATVVRVYDPSLISGLLQTPAYAEAMFRALGKSDEAVGEAVAERVKRQSALYLPSKRFIFVLGEAALRWRPVEAGVLGPQLQRLLELSGRPNVLVGIQPLDKPAPVLPMGFWLFEIPDEEPQGFVEYYEGEQVVAGDRALPYVARFNAVEESAVFGDEAGQMIEGLLAG